MEEMREIAHATGWRVEWSDTADLAEWDAFESNWNLDLVELARNQPGTPLGLEAARVVRERQDEYANGYRGVLGFGYLVLARV